MVLLPTTLRHALPESSTVSGLHESDCACITQGTARFAALLFARLATLQRIRLVFCSVLSETIDGPTIGVTEMTYSMTRCSGHFVGVPAQHLLVEALKKHKGSRRRQSLDLLLQRVPQKCGVGLTYEAIRLLRIGLPAQNFPIPSRACRFRV